MIMKMCVILTCISDDHVCYEEVVYVLSVCGAYKRGSVIVYSGRVWIEYLLKKIKYKKGSQGRA